MTLLDDEPSVIEDLEVEVLPEKTILSPLTFDQEILQVLLGAKALLKGGKGWHQGSCYLHEDGDFRPPSSYCTLGALLDVQGRSMGFEAERYFMRVNKIHSIPIWNDTATTTYGDVAHAFNVAIESLAKKIYEDSQ